MEWNQSFMIITTEPLLVPLSADKTKASPAGLLVNNPRNDNPKCVELI